MLLLLATPALAPSTAEPVLGRAGGATRGRSPSPASRRRIWIVALAPFLLATPALAQSGDATQGKATFEDRCTMCHAPTGGQGPKLAGVVGRKAGAQAGFAYSAALKASGLTWTPANLDKFLAGPRALVPGTAMTVTISDAAQRRDIIAYLASLK